MAGRFDPRLDPFNPPQWLLDEDQEDPDTFADIDYNDPASMFEALGAGTDGPPMPAMISADVVRSKSEVMRAKILADWQRLRNVLDRHETTMQKRWAKKTKEQRKRIILTAWPNMSANHRPDFDAFRKQSSSYREHATRYHDAYVWPYINLEDLTKPRILPLFMNARGRNPPSLFAMADEDAAHLGLVSKAIVPAFLSNHTTYFRTIAFPKHYAELIEWDDDNDGFMDMVSGKGLHPGQGLLILEIQQRIMDFLLKCSNEIMHDIPADELTTEKYTPQPVPALPVEAATGFASLAVMAAEAPYRKPADLDWDRLQSLFAAKKSAAEDHIWALREDPTTSPTASKITKSTVRSLSRTAMAKSIHYSSCDVTKCSGNGLLKTSL